MIKCKICGKELEFEGEPFTREAIPYLKNAPALYRCKYCNMDWLYCEFPDFSILGNHLVLISWDSFNRLNLKDYSKFKEPKFYYKK